MRAVQISICLIIFLCNGVVFAGWKFLPRISVAEIYTDNIDLLPSEDKEHEFATEIKPGFIVTNESSRLDVNVNYALQGIFFARDSDRNTTFQQLDSGATLTLIPNSLDFLASANRFQQVTDSTQPVGFGAVSTSENVDDVTTFSTGPRLRFRLGSSANGLVQYSQQFVNYDENSRIDTESKNLRVGLDGESSTGKVRWEIGGSSKTVMYENNFEDEKISTASLEINYRFNSRWGLDGTAGYEDYELNNVLSEEDSYGETWTAGFTWNPTVRTTIKVRGGEQFFGKTESFSVNQRSRRITVELGRTESIQSLEQLQFTDTTDLGSGNLVNQASLPDEVEIFISERYYLSTTYRFPKSDIGLRIFDEDRRFDISGQTEQSRGGSLSYSLLLGSKTRLASSYFINETEEVSGAVDRLRQLNITGSKTFSNKLLTSLTISRLIRDGDIQGYNANLIRVDAALSF